MVSTIISLVAALGIGGLGGAFVNSYLEHKKLLNQQEHELKRKRYLCTLILMLTKLDPVSGLRHLQDHRPDLRDLKDVDAEIRTELLNAMLFASDDVITEMAAFIGNPGHTAYVKTVTAMRRDLWNKKTTIDETALQAVAEHISQSQEETAAH
jgi:hypothetical protein